MTPATLVLIIAILLSGCASTLDVLDDVRKGQSEAQATASMHRDDPKFIFENKTTKYLVYGYIATFFDMYDNTVTYYFIKLKDGKVVDKGMVRDKQRREIKLIDPNFDTSRLIRQPNKVSQPVS